MEMPAGYSERLEAKRNVVAQLKPKLSQMRGNPASQGREDCVRSESRISVSNNSDVVGAGGVSSLCWRKIFEISLTIQKMIRAIIDLVVWTAPAAAGVG